MGEVEVEEGPVQYRYLVVSDHIAALEGRLRTLAVAGPTLEVDDGEFGVQDGHIHADSEWLLEHSQLRVRLGSRVSRPAVELYPAAALQPEPAVLCVRAALTPIYGPPCSVQPDVQVFALGASRWALQPRCMHEHGEPLHPGQFVEFIFRASAFDDAAICLTVGSEAGAILGTAWLLPVHRTTTHGSPVLPLAGPDGAVIGHVGVEFLQINPIAQEHRTDVMTSLATANAAHWDHSQRLMVGHRGMGSSHVAAGSGKLAAPVTENTVASFAEAQRMGAHYVEFDVQVSKDGVPFVYHNFEAYVVASGLTSAGAVPTRVELADLTLLQMQGTQLISRQQLSHLPIGGSFEALLSGSATPPPTPMSHHDTSECPSLAKVLEDLPVSLGYDVEIKYPLLLKGGSSWENDVRPPREPNQYIDLILATVFAHAGVRPLFFTCFDPDICLLLKLKQKKYPVAFLTCAGTPTHGDYEDLRCRSLEAAMAFAAGNGLLGIAPDSAPVVSSPAAVAAAHALGLAVFTWGGTNNVSANVALQQKHNVDAIIVDRIGLPYH